MIHKDYLFDEREELKRQLERNVLQLRDLSLMAKVDRINVLVCATGLIVSVAVFLLLISHFLFHEIPFAIGGLALQLRGEVAEYAGSIAVFVFLGIIQFVKILHDAWLRGSEINFMIHQQQATIAYGEKVLYEEEK